MHIEYNDDEYTNNQSHVMNALQTAIYTKLPTLKAPENFDDYLKLMDYYDSKNLSCVKCGEEPIEYMVNSEMGYCSECTERLGLKVDLEDEEEESEDLDENLFNKLSPLA